jgi:protein-tyrosine phosphatase
MTSSIPNHAPFQSLLNFRDVGININKLSSEAIVKDGLFYRSARPDNATASDRERLKSEYKIRTIIDLRTATEKIQHVHKSTLSRMHSAPAITPSDPAQPLEIPGIDYREINFNGSAYSKALIKQLSYGHVAKLAGLYAFGYRNQAISVLGTNVMAQRGLTGLAEDSLEHCTAEVKAVFNVLADVKSYPLIVHCTQGKDRTGLIVLLVLMLLGAPLQAIDQDYMLSESELKPEREERLKEIAEIGLPESFAGCDPQWAGQVSGWINEKYGGIESYLTRCGVSEAQMGAVRSTLAVAQ